MRVDRVRIQSEDFSLDCEWRGMRAGLDGGTGAVAAFIGLVREVRGDTQTTLELEHYPGMTEDSIERIVAAAEERWNLIGALVIHRVGRLEPAEQIVLVLCASRHRAEAFAACEFIMDFLKTDAVLWKRESSGGGSRWVESSARDDERAAGWRQRGQPVPTGKATTER